MAGFNTILMTTSHIVAYFFGATLYVRSTLNAVQYTLATQFPEQIWCYFVDSKGVVFMLVSVTEHRPSMCIVLGIMTYSVKLLEKWVVRINILSLWETLTAYFCNGLHC